MLPIDNTLDFQHATNPPPAYQQAILLEDTTNSRHNEVLPSYSQVTGSFLQTKDIIKQPSSNNDLNVITSQPNSTNLNNINNYKIKGFFRDYKPIFGFNLSNNYLSFSQQVCCHPLLSFNNGYSFNGLFSSTNKTTVFDINDQQQNKIIYFKKHNLIIKNISLSPDNNSFIALYTSNNEENIKYDDELYLVTHAVSDSVQSLKKEEFNHEIKINCPLKEIYSIHYDGDQLYIVGKENNRISLQSTYLDKINIEKNVQWKEITSLDDKQICNANFSNDGSLLFLVSKYNGLSIFSKSTNWSEIKTITSLKSFPVDINSSSELMIFIVRDKLEIKSLTSEKNPLIKDTDTRFSTACFIPGTKDLLAFTLDNKILFLKHSVDNEDCYNITSEKKIKCTVEKAYFDQQDANKLIVLTNSIDYTTRETTTSILSCLVGYPALLSCLTAIVYFAQDTSCFQINSLAIAAEKLSFVAKLTSSFCPSWSVLICIGAYTKACVDKNSIEGKLIDINYIE